jgi:hypothetical protein
MLFVVGLEDNIFFKKFIRWFINFALGNLARNVLIFGANKAQNVEFVFEYVHSTRT